MRILWDVPIAMDDDIILRADVFLPERPGRYPVLISYGPYAKGLAFQLGYPTAWESLVTAHPDVTAGSTNAYQNWEVVDPEKWTPHGYAIVRVDSRGCGRSPGFIDHFSARETADFAACIEWAADQPWADGQVGTSGVSYFGMNQWQVAAARPRGLAAMCVWEGASDFYRDASHHGGILSSFWEHWYDKQIKVVQYGLGERGPRSALNGLLVCGDETLTDEQLAANRVDFGAQIRSHPLLDDYHRERTADWSQIEVPLLSAANWGGAGLHLRGNIEGYLKAGSRQKWLETHGLEHWTSYYTDYGREIQLAFFDHFLKGIDNGWDERPAVTLQLRHVDGTFTERFEPAWPLPGTKWLTLALDPTTSTLVADVDMGAVYADVDTGAGTELAPSRFELDGYGEGVTFRLPPAQHSRQLVGPLAAHLWVSTTGVDADLFATVRIFDPQGAEISFIGAVDPNAPASIGWLRLSHRELDDEASQPWRPVHPHTRALPVEPDEIYRCDLEIWPTCIELPPGYTFAVTIGGRDYENESLPPILMSNFKNQMTGCGPFLHDDPVDRPVSVRTARTTVHCGGDTPSRLIVPVVVGS
jgi:predicted acyl esterase